MTQNCSQEDNQSLFECFIFSQDNQKQTAILLAYQLDVSLTVVSFHLSITSTRRLAKFNQQYLSRAEDYDKGNVEGERVCFVGRKVFV